ncbi:MAG TPA: tandem-95 repeat protein [Anaerolineae bacterium]|nr:tandem-95 repeat protein [Anaerolineae bacterium]
MATAAQLTPLVDTCFVSVNNSGTTDYSSADGTALQTAINSEAAGSTLKVAGTCAGVQTVNGETQTLYINKDMTIVGGYATNSWGGAPDPAANETVLDAAGGGRVVYITNNANVILSTLTLRNGDAGLDYGGGIYANVGTNLVFEYGRIEGSQADLGGGIMADAPAIIHNSVITGNSAAFGGGLYIKNTAVTMTQSSLLGNQTTIAPGGGIYNEASSLFIENSTFALNQAAGNGGGIYQSGGTTTLRYTTFSQNSAPTGGGINAGSGTISLLANIMTNNTGGDCVGSNITDIGYNLIADGSCISAGTSSSGTAGLDSLANYGGDPTSNGSPPEMFALLATSPALNAIPFGFAGCGATDLIDQRSLTRMSQSGCEIGAFERQTAVPIANNDAYTTTEDTILTIPAPGILTNDSDNDGDSLSARLLNSPSSGTLDLNGNGAFVYTPTLDFNGNDNFNYLLFSGGALPTVGHWSFNEGSGNSTYDASGNNLTGTLRDNATFTATLSAGLNFPNITALDLDGTGDRVNIPDSDDINLTDHSRRTVSAWFRADNVGVSSRKQIIWEEGGEINGLNIYLFDGALYGGAWSDTNSWSGTWLSTTLASSGQWHHVALVLNSDSTTGPEADSLHLYLDGVLVQSGPAAQLATHIANNGIGDLHEDSKFHDTGAVSGTGGHGFAGQIDEVRVMNVAATAADVVVLLVTWPGLSDTAVVTLNVTPTIDLLTTDPAHQALNVPPTQAIHLNFDEPVNLTTVSTETIGLHGSMGGYSWNYGLSGNTLLITPTTSFYPGEVMRVSMSDGMEDLGGVTAVPEQKQIQFTAATTAPEACTPQFTNIGAGLTGVSSGDIAWGDYDNDGDLDILLTGVASNRISRIYRNDNGNFSDIGAGLIGVNAGNVAWGDYDNDGDLDILLTGYNISNQVSKVYRNDDGSFIDIGAGLTAVYFGAAVWGDYDNDGDLDILLTGVATSGWVSHIYRNDGGSFINIGAGLTAVDGAADWGDYDNDGDLDILLTGSDGSNQISRLYRNDGGSFTDIGAGLTGVASSAVVWGDYDNDGDLDILLTGNDGSNRVSQIYRNDDGAFIDIAAGLVGVSNGAANWGDYDNDGDLDILLVGYDGSNHISYIYRNDEGAFTNMGVGLPAVENGNVAWGDYDNDGDLDILLTGYASTRISHIYRNDPGCALADDQYTAVINQPLTVISATGVLNNDAIGPYNIAVTTPPTNGTLDLALDGSFVYTPTTSFTGVDSFVYQLSGWTEPLTATVTIDVVPVADLAGDDSYTTAEDTPLSIVAPGVLVNDVDNAVTLLVDSAPTNGDVNLTSDGSFVYTPTLNFNGSDSFVYRVTLVSDGAISDTAVVTLTVIPVNDAPLAVSDSYTTVQNIPLTIPAPGVLDNDSDVEGDNLAVTLQIGPLSGTVTLAGDGGFVYTPTANFNGADAFTYTVRDGAVLPAAYWPFAEGSGTSTADASGNGINGTLNGPVFTTTVPVTPTFTNNYALAFDGTAMVNIPDAPEINTSAHNQRTVALWFRADDTSINTRKQILWEEGGLGNGLNLYLYDGALYAGAWSSDNSWNGAWLSSTAVSDGVWHHVALVLDSNSTSGATADSLHLYLDGVWVSSGSAAQLASHAANNAIGNLRGDSRFHDTGVTGTGGHGFAGLIDDVRIMNLAVDTDEALQMMTTRPGLTASATVDLTVAPANCWVEATGDNLADYTSLDSTAVQTAVNNANPDDILKIAGTCAGVQTINSNNQTVYVTQSVTLQGGYTTANWLVSDPIANPTVLDAENNGRVIRMAGNQMVTLDGLILTNGTIPSGFGGAVYIAPNSIVTMTNSTIQQNTATQGSGIYHNGTSLHLNRVTLHNNVATQNAPNGGGLYHNAGQLSIVNTLFSQNSGNWGGALWLNQAATVQNSTFMSNTASYRGAAIGVGNSGVLTMTNSTLTNNNAGQGGGIYNGNIISVTHSTLFLNTAGTGGGIYNDGGTVEMFGIILSGSENCYTGGSGSVTAKYSLVDSTNDNCGLTDGVDGNIVGVAPQLAGLADNGGPTLTHAPLPDSPVVGAIPSAACFTTVDQRGLARPQGGSCDIGSVEAWRLNIAIASPTAAQFTWAVANTGCSYDLYESDMPYFSPMGVPTYSGLTSGDTVDNVLGNIGINRFFINVASCPLGGGYSNTVGEFDFAIVSGQ